MSSKRKTQSLLFIFSDILTFSYNNYSKIRISTTFEETWQGKKCVMCYIRKFVFFPYWISWISSTTSLFSMEQTIDYRTNIEISKLNIENQEANKNVDVILRHYRIMKMFRSWRQDYRAIKRFTDDFRNLSTSFVVSSGNPLFCVIFQKFWIYIWSVSAFWI